MRHTKFYYKHKETVNNFFWHGFQLFSKSSATVLIFFLSAEYLKPRQFGLLNYLMTIIGLLTIFCDLGLALAISKFVAEYKTLQSKKLDSILFSVSIAAIAMSTLISVVVILLGHRIFKNDYRYILCFVPCLFFMPLTGIIDGTYRGLKQFRRLALVNSVVGMFSLVISFILI